MTYIHFQSDECQQCRLFFFEGKIIEQPERMICDPKLNTEMKEVVDRKSGVPHVMKIMWLRTWVRSTCTNAFESIPFCSLHPFLPSSTPGERFRNSWDVALSID
jgi:hypothetical protein